MKRLRQKRNLTQGQVATYANVGRSWLSHLETGRFEQPDRDKLERMARILDAPPETLLAAAGYRVAPLPLREERTTYEIVRELEAAVRREEERRPVELTVEGFASAGPGAPVETVYLEPEMRGRPIHLIEVTGTCLEPELRPGDLVVYDEDVLPHEGDVVVAERGGERVIKRYYGDELRGDDGQSIAAVGWDIRGTVFEVRKRVRRQKAGS